MRVTKSSPKLIAALLGLGSVVVFAGVMSDMKLHSSQFMDSVKIEVASKTGRIKSDRFVASSVSNDKELPAVQYIPYNKDNRDLINGEWEITRVQDVDGNAYYDKFGNYEDRNSWFVADFKLTATSTVTVDNDQAQVFKISLMPSSKTIVLFKIINGGYEILEARKLVKQQVDEPQIVPQEKREEGPKEQEKITGLRINGNVDLVLERALHPNKTSKLLKGESINGSVSIVDGYIQSLLVDLYIDGQELFIDIPSSEIKDGGMFEAMIGQETVHGIITNNGEQAYRVRFATGPLQGAMLNFVTREKLQEIQDQEYQSRVQTQEAEDFREDYYSNNTEEYNQYEIDQEQLNHENARMVAEDPYTRSGETDLSQEEKNQRVEESGYRF